MTDMELMLKEIINLVRDCESQKTSREAERIRNERKTYEDIRKVVEPFIAKSEVSG